MISRENEANSALSGEREPCTTASFLYLYFKFTTVPQIQFRESFDSVINKVNEFRVSRDS